MRLTWTWPPSPSSCVDHLPRFAAGSNAVLSREPSNCRAPIPAAAPGVSRSLQFRRSASAGRSRARHTQSPRSRSRNPASLTGVGYGAGLGADLDDGAVVLERIRLRYQQLEVRHDQWLFRNLSQQSSRSATVSGTSLSPDAQRRTVRRCTRMRRPRAPCESFRRLMALRNFCADMVMSENVGAWGRIATGGIMPLPSF